MKIKDLLDTWGGNRYTIVTVFSKDLDNVILEESISSLYKSPFINKTVKYWYVDDFPKDDMTNISIDIG